jgi:4-amino-4-deoxy-L-arabinose transferase-like glycosyltransferase
MLSLGILFLIDMRMLGWAFADISANKLATRLNVPMLLGFVVMFGTGILLFYAVPVRSAQSIWFRVKIGLLIVCAINAFMFHRKMTASIGAWDSEPCAPKALRLGALVSLVTWSVIVICGRFIAYDWFDCSYPQSDFIRQIAGCIDGQTQF